MEWRLVLENGRFVLVKWEGTDETGHEVYREMELAIENGGMWNANNWCDVRATYGDMPLHFINMNKIVGILWT